MIKLLSIGNSFSQDAQKWLFPIAAAGSTEMVCVNLYIGGCSLETHYNMLQSGEAAYDYEINGVFVRHISLPEALASENWDIITLQQASHDSGMYETYQPYLTELAAYVRKTCPSAKLYFHQTWAYDVESDHPAFVRYEYNQQQMYDRLTAAACQAAESIDVPVIPVGEVIQALRQQNLPVSLVRDGFHLSLGYGRYAAAATWYITVLGGTITDNTFLPPAVDGADEAIIAIIKETVNRICGK